MIEYEHEMGIELRKPVNTEFVREAINECKRCNKRRREGMGGRAKTC